MDVRVTIAVKNPGKVDQTIVAEKVPGGNGAVQVVKGGLDVVDDVHNTKSVIATAAVEAYLDIDPKDWVSA